MLLEVGVGVAVIVLLWWYFNSEENPLDKVPGPKRLPIIGNAIQLMRIKPDEVLEEFLKLTKEHGDKFLFKTGSKRILHISAPADIEAVLSHSKNITKSLPYTFLKDWLGNGLLLSTGAHWHKRRKILTPTFHFNILKNFATVIEEKTKDFVQLLKEKKGAAVEITPLISDFTLFTICETAMGTKLDDNQSSATVEYKTAIHDMGLLLLGRLTNMWAWSDFIFNKTPNGKKFTKLNNIARSFADKVLIDRKASRASNKIEVKSDEDFGTKRRLALLDLLLEAEDKGQIDMEGIRDEVNTFMFEGHDTTAVAITFGLMLLADHEQIQNRVYEEILNVLGDADREPSISNLADMKYLDAVIKEILRLYPSVPFIGREITEDFMMGDLLVKKGTTVDLHIYTLHRRPETFPDPDAFKPERFIDAEMKHPYAYVPFSAGPRNCIGQRFALQEMKCTLCEIVRNFKLVPKVKGYRPRIITDLVLRPVDPIEIKFIARK